MAVETFYMRVKARSPAHYVDFPLPAGERLWGYLFGEPNSRKDIQFHNMTGKIQDGLSKEQVSKIDYLAGSGPFHFFSPNFLSKMQSRLDGEVVFHKIMLLSEDQKFEFYLANIINKLNIVDHDLSQTYAQNRRSSTTIIKTGFERPFLIARESEPLKGSVVVVSNDFKQMCIKEKLSISFKETLTKIPL